MATRGRRVTEKQWEGIIVLALRGNNVPAISRMTGLHIRTLRRMWAVGYPKEPWGQTPIRRIIEEEQAKARALRTQIGEADNPTPFEAEEKANVEAQLGSASLVEKTAARRDALESRVAEGQLVKLARGNVVQLAGAAVGLVAPAAKVARAIGKLLAKRAEAEEINAEEGIATLREIARYLKDVVEAGHRAMEMERLLLGDPSSSGKLAQDAASMSEDEALTLLGNAAKVHAAMAARGWSIVKGGAPKRESAAAAQGQRFDTAASHTSETGDGPADAGLNGGANGAHEPEPTQ